MTKATIIKEMKERLKRKQFTNYGICYLFDMVTFRYGYDKIGNMFPEISNKKLIYAFGGNHSSIFYWERGVWNTGRLDFFNMLYEKYKDDNTKI